MPEFTQCGLPIKKYLVPFSTAFFNAQNDHNPTVARPCVKCNGDGKVCCCESHNSVATALHLTACDACNAKGYFDEPVRFFDNDNAEVEVAANEFGWFLCPWCEKRSLVSDRSSFTGARCKCGQRIKIVAV